MRLRTNYAFFKNFDVTAASAGCPNLAGWLAGMQRSHGGLATWQNPATDQRVHQAHPNRRASAEPCMRLHPTTLGVGENPNWQQQLLTLSPPAAELRPAEAAAQEAGWRLCQRRGVLAGFLVRKAAEFAEGDGYFRGRIHPKAGGQHWVAATSGGDGGGSGAEERTRLEWVGSAPPPYGPGADQRHRWPAPAATIEGGGAAGAADASAAAAALDQHLMQLAGLLTGLCTAEEAKAGFDHTSPVALLGGLIGTPRDMSVGACAQVRAGLAAMLGTQPVSTL
eukprot:SAG11_NODE_1766_length_4285_cov_2.424032_2_plen_280_part_00